MGYVRCLGLLLAVCALAVVASGCVHEGDDAGSSLPWSRPASWEGQQLGVPL